MSQAMSLDFSHGVSAGAITVALAKGYTMYNGSNVDFSVQVEAGVAAGAAAVVADSLLPNQSAVVKAGAAGAVLSGAMYVWKQDMNWTVWVPVGAASYFLSDWAMKMYAKNAAASRSPPPDSTPAVAGY